MAYTTAEGRRELLDDVAAAADEIGSALAALGAAYEQLDEHAADALEERLFGPVQAAYARVRHAYADFAARVGLEARAIAPRDAGAASTGARGFVEEAVEAVEEADAILSELQDSMLPVEVGDQELRAGLSAVRELLGPVSGRARELVRVLGR
ncbi:MAG: hypothetical protein IRZ32_15810 [Solirubrobacteraceae bacterium]|nr:hypothetical protein [Solirubrobacteraceae bacterium]